MIIPEKIAELHDIIAEKLTPLIKGDYYLVDAPYHSNIGDVLIWQGELDFLSTLPGKRIGTSGHFTFPFPKLPKDVTILLNGGGNFGDLWRFYHDFRTKVITHYPDNPIVMFPQSVWYDDQSLIAKDAAIYTAHPNLHLCARDQWSFDFMKTHFPGTDILLVPDMAFFINDKRLSSYRNLHSGKKLLLLRKDRELPSEFTPPADIKEYDVTDWPTKEHEPKRHRWIDRCSYAFGWRLKNHPQLLGLSEKVMDMIADTAIRKSHTATGLKFLSRYDDIITTRLHVMILGLLLHKENIIYVDNTSKKLSAFADTWLHDLKLRQGLYSPHLKMNKIKVQSITITRYRIEIRFSTEGEIGEYFKGENVFWCEYSLPVDTTPESIAIIPFIANVLPIVWLCDATLEVPTIDGQFYECLDAVKKGYQNMYAYLDFKGEVISHAIDSTNSQQVTEIGGGKMDSSAMLFSGGVDAFSTLLTHQAEHPLLITVRGADLTLRDHEGWKNVSRHIAETAEIFHTQFTTISSNLKDFINDDLVNKKLISKTGDNYWHGFQHGIGLIGLTAPLSATTGFKKLYIASTLTYEQAGKLACASDPTIDNNIRFNNTEIIHDGSEFSRQEKVTRIVSESEKSGVYPMLRVCWMHEGGENCCQCEKCLRTLFEIYVGGGKPEKYGFNISRKTLRHSRRNMIIYGFSQNRRAIYWDDIQSGLIKNRNIKLPDTLRWIRTSNLKHPYIYPDVSFYHTARQLNRAVLKAYWNLRNRFTHK